MHFWKKDKFLFSKKIPKNKKIPLLVLDTAWYKLFEQEEKPHDIKLKEDKLNELLKEQSNIMNALKSIKAEKKKLLNGILDLSAEAYENDSDSAKSEITGNKDQILKINNEILNMEKRLERLPDELALTNLNLFELTADHIYKKMRNDKSRLANIEPQIEQLRERIKSLVDEKALLEERIALTYSFLHNLIGSEITDILDEVNDV